MNKIEETLLLFCRIFCPNPELGGSLHARMWPRHQKAEEEDQEGPLAGRLFQLTKAKSPKKLVLSGF